jgi:hypothetical protein
LPKSCPNILTANNATQYIKGRDDDEGAETKKVANFREEYFNNKCLLAFSASIVILIFIKIFWPLLAAGIKLHARKWRGKYFFPEKNNTF